MLRMSLINKIRKDYFNKKLNRNQIAEKYSCSWDTVDRLVKMTREDLKKRGKRPNKKAVVTTPEVINAIDEYINGYRPI